MKMYHINVCTKSHIDSLANNDLWSISEYVTTWENIPLIHSIEKIGYLLQVDRNAFSTQILFALAVTKNHLFTKVDQIFTWLQSSQKFDPLKIYFGYLWMISANWWISWLSFSFTIFTPILQILNSSAPSRVGCDNIIICNEPIEIATHTLQRE